MRVRFPSSALIRTVIRFDQLSMFADKSVRRRLRHLPVWRMPLLGRLGSAHRLFGRALRPMTWTRGSAPLKSSGLAV